MTREAEPFGPNPPGSNSTSSVARLTRELDSITPWVRWWLRAEGITGFLLGAFCWYAIRGFVEWPFFVLALLLPDVSALGYLGGNHLGAITYNLAHNWFVGGLVLGVGFWFGQDTVVLVGAVLVAHTGLDRVMGYGLKYPTGFGDTHLGRIGRRR